MATCRAKNIKKTKATMPAWRIVARDVLLVNPEDAKAKKLTGPTLYMYEKTDTEPKVHTFVFDVTGPLNQVKKIEVFFNKLEVQKDESVIPRFMPEWKALLRPVHFIGIEGYDGFDRSNYRSFVVNRAVRNHCQVLLEFQATSDR
jgi:hypothetical protein